MFVCFKIKDSNHHFVWSICLQLSRINLMVLHERDVQVLLQLLLLLLLLMMMMMMVVVVVVVTATLATWRDVLSPAGPCETVLSDQSSD